MREHAPPSEQQENAGDKARCSGAARHPEAACSGAEHGGACSPSAAPASHVAWCSVVPPGVATAPPPSAPADPLEQLLGELLAAEAGGDPFSIINLFVAEQLEVQRQQAARQAQQQLQRQQQRARQAADAAMQDAMCKQESAAQACTAPRASGDKLADSTELRHAHAAAAALARQPAAPQAAGAQPSAPAAGPQRPPRGASDGENVSANVRHRHRRSSSMVLPAEFDPSELSAAGPSGLFAGPSGLLGGPSGLLPGGGSVPAPAPAPLMRASSEPASFMERHAQAPALPPAPLQAQESSSKQLYVQQWLQRSTAELEQASTVAGSPRSAAAPAESEVEQQAGGLSSPASSLAQTVQPMQRGVVHPAAAVDTAEEEQEEEAAGQAQRDADGGAAVGMSALSEMSASSGDGSHAPPPPRPSAPVPPSGSSLMDGSSALSASLDLARMPAAQQAAAQQPQQRPVAASPRLLQNPFGGDVRAAGRQWRHGGSSSGSSSYAASSSVDGSEGEAPMAAAEGPAEEEAASAGQPAEAHADASEHSEPQAALSFGQLQAVSGVAGGANRLPDDAAAEADDWRPREPSSSTDGSEAEAAPVVAAAAAAAAAAGAAAAAAARAQPPATITAQQSASELADSEGRSSLGSEVEISYGEQYSRAAVRQAVAVADNSADVAAQATSPRLVPQPQQASALPAQSPRQQQQQQVLPRPRSPLHAADDRYPSSPPASPGGLQRTVSAGSRPASPAGAFLYSPASSRRASLAEEASAASRPASPPVAALHRSSEQREAHPEGSFVTVVERSLSAGSNSSSGGGGGAEGLLRDGGAASPYAMLRFGTDAEAEGCSDAAAAAAAAAAAEALLSPRSPAATMAAASSPPGTPLVVSPGDDDASTCPGSAHVEDDTVVQSGEFVCSLRLCRLLVMQRVVDVLGSMRLQACAAAPSCPSPPKPPVACPRFCFALQGLADPHPACPMGLCCRGACACLLGRGDGLLLAGACRGLCRGPGAAARWVRRV